jgi:hypothetical protein
VYWLQPRCTDRGVVCKIWGSENGVGEDASLLGYYTILTDWCGVTVPEDLNIQECVVNNLCAQVSVSWLQLNGNVMVMICAQWLQLLFQVSAVPTLILARLKCQFIFVVFIRLPQVPPSLYLLYVITKPI